MDNSSNPNPDDSLHRPKLQPDCIDQDIPHQDCVMGEEEVVEGAEVRPEQQAPSRTPFTNLSQIDSDLALARTLQDQVRFLQIQLRFSLFLKNELLFSFRKGHT